MCVCVCGYDDKLTRMREIVECGIIGYIIRLHIIFFIAWIVCCSEWGVAYGGSVLIIMNYYAGDLLEMGSVNV